MFTMGREACCVVPVMNAVIPRSFSQRKREAQFHAEDPVIGQPALRPEGLDGVPEPDKEPLQITFAPLLDLAALEVDVIERDLFLLHQLVQTGDPGEGFGKSGGFCQNRFLVHYDAFLSVSCDIWQFLVWAGVRICEGADEAVTNQDRVKYSTLEWKWIPFLNVRSRPLSVFITIHLPFCWN